MKKSRAFTLLELLTVIAIIAILSAIILPVYARAKVNANKSSDITNMRSLSSALLQYRVDQGGMPPALLGYVTRYDSGPNMGNVIPANQLKTYLYPKRVDSIETFRPIPNRTGFVETTTAVWPDADSRAVGTAPIIDVNGDGNLTNADDVAGARQAFTGGTQVRANPTDATTALQFYKVSGYDVAEVKTPTTPRTEMRYTLFWTRFGRGDGTTTYPGGGSQLDDPRQLGYADPPETTVVTWNTFYRDYTNGRPDQIKGDMVLFLSGGVRYFDSRSLSDRSWRVLP
jgi:prepilin-type N-terminal cleavage/methylation domain-containing protein